MNDTPYKYKSFCYIWVAAAYGVMLGVCLYLKPFHEPAHTIYLFGPLLVLLGAGCLASRRVGYSPDEEGITVHGLLSRRRFRWSDLRSIKEGRVSRGVNGCWVYDTKNRKAFRFTDLISEYETLRDVVKKELRKASGERRQRKA